LIAGIEKACENTMEYIDCHCHLAENYFYKHIKEFIQEWNEKGIKQIGAMATNGKTAKRTIELATTFPETIVAGIGRHPWGAHKTTEEELLKFEEWISKPEVKIIGEVGLDHYFIREPEKWEKQREVFRFFLDMAEKYQKPLMIHSTGAEKEIFELLETRKLKTNVCFHWFSGDISILTKLMDLGAYFSINPAVAQSKRHQQVVQTVAMDHLLTESDGTVKFRGEIGTPLLMPFVCKEIAKRKKIPFEAVVQAVQTAFEKYL